MLFFHVYYARILVFEEAINGSDPLSGRPPVLHAAGLLETGALRNADAMTKHVCCTLVVNPGGCRRYSA